MIKNLRQLSTNYFRSICSMLIWSILFALPLTSSAQNSIQSNGDRTPGYWTLGLNAGFSYQSSDVRSQLQGGGWGLTLAKNLYYAPGSPIAFDLRGRFLFARQFGLDDSPLFAIGQDEALNGLRGPDYTQYPTNLDIAEGFVFPNHRTTVGELALEGVLSFNRLRERTNVHLALFGGIGIDWYRTKLNQLDANGNPYYDAYANLLENANRNRRSELRNSILDDSYETLAHDFENSGKIGLMPSLGIELGYQVTPRFSIMAGHRVTFSGTNDLDGQLWTDTRNGSQDLYHYTQFGLRWILEPARRSGRAPVIAFEQPEVSPYALSAVPTVVRARISNVSTKMDVEASLNGNPVDFDFGSGSFRKVLTQLRIGENTFTIQAENRFGSDRETITLIYGTNEAPPPPPPPGRAPQITITQPTSTPYRTTLGTADLLATVREVSRQNQITLSVNGESPSFNFDNRSGQLRATLALRPGQNVVSIRATNANGSEEQQTTIIYQEAIVDIDPPSVRINRPANGDRTASNSTYLRASIRNIEDRDDLTVTVRGERFNDFSFDAGRNELTATVPLRWGSNTIEVIARNSSGSDQAQVTVYREDGGISPPPPPPPPPPSDPRPSVRMTRPVDGHTTPTDYISFAADVDYVDRRNQIRVTVNGRPYNDFSFNAGRGRVTGTVSLDPGNNTILVQAQTRGGQAQDGVNVRYTRPPQPNVTISEPANGTRVQQREIELVARTQHVENRGEVTLDVNDRRISNFSFDRGIIRANLNLTPGNNEIIVRVMTFGGSNQASTNVIYEQIRRPSVTITSPSTDPYTTTDQAIEVQAQVTDVERADQITVRYNNRTRSNFSFDQQRQQVTINLRLSPGAHPFEIEVNTAGGTASDEATLIYQNTPAPTVTITQPNGGATQSTNRSTVRARITGISSREDIQFRVNGSSSDEFSFRRESFEADISLRPGTNQVEIIAENERGSARDEVAIVYNEPVTVEPPQITFTQPSEPGTTASDSRQTIVATITNVSLASDISVRVNNRATRGFRFDSRSGQLQLTLDLREGNNAIAITAQNEQSVVTEATNITYQPEVSAGPTVTINSVSRPVINPMAPGVGSSTVRATIEGVSSRDQVSFLVNGEVISEFDFQSGTGEFVGETQLSRGENVIIVRATTAEGTAEDQRTIDF